MSSREQQSYSEGETDRSARTGDSETLKSSEIEDLGFWIFEDSGTQDPPELAQGFPRPVPGPGQARPGPGHVSGGKSSVSRTRNPSFAHAADPPDPPDPT